MEETKGASVKVFDPIRIPIDQFETLQRASLPVLDGPASPLHACSAASLDYAPCDVCPHLPHRYESVRQAAYCKPMHQRAVDREDSLKLEIQARLLQT
jgi:hypothetical protein